MPSASDAATPRPVRSIKAKGKDKDKDKDRDRDEKDSRRASVLV